MSKYARVVVGCVSHLVFVRLSLQNAPINVRRARQLQVCVRLAKAATIRMEMTVLAATANVLRAWVELRVLRAMATITSQEQHANVNCVQLCCFVEIVFANRSVYFGLDSAREHSAVLLWYPVCLFTLSVIGASWQLARATASRVKATRQHATAAQQTIIL